MPRPQKRKLKQVNAQFFEEDIKIIKELADSEGMTSWHPKLRQVVHLGIQAAKKRRIIK